MSKKTAAKDGEDETTSGGVLKKVLAGVLVLVLVGAAGWWFVLRPGPSAPQPGAIVPLDSIQINLDGTHYLKLGLALQLTTSAKEVDGSKALDAAIDMFSGRPMTTLAQAARRDALKKKLSNELSDAYDGEVMGVYFTEFVTQ